MSSIIATVAFWAVGTFGGEILDVLFTKTSKSAANGLRSWLDIKSSKR